MRGVTPHAGEPNTTGTAAPHFFGVSKPKECARLWPQTASPSANGNTTSAGTASRPSPSGAPGSLDPAAAIYQPGDAAESALHCRIT
jgi:hypothetical protein